MSWIGKIIGGTIGLLFGGPLGMIAGAALGHLVDKSAEFRLQYHEPGPAEQSRYFPGDATEGEKRQMIYFVSVFSMLAKLCTASGTMNARSRERVEQFIRDNMDSNGRSAQLARNIFDEASRSSFSFESFASQFYSYFGADSNMLVTMMHILFQVSMADGTMDSAEQRLIDSAGQIFRFSYMAMETFRRQYASGYRYSSSGASGYSGNRSSGSYGSYGSGAGARQSQSSSLAHSYAVLGLTSDASDDEVKKAYRKLSIEYHPDMVASKGLPEEFAKFATEKFKEINAAYQEIKASRGLK